MCSLLPFQVIQAVVFLNSWSKRLTRQCSLNNEDADSRRWLEAWAWLLIFVRGVEESFSCYSQACLQLKDVTSLSLSPNHTRFFKGPETYREEWHHRTTTLPPWRRKATPSEILHGKYIPILCNQPLRLSGFLTRLVGSHWPVNPQKMYQDV